MHKQLWNPTNNNSICVSKDEWTSFVSSDSFNLKKNRRGELLPLRKSKKWPSHCDVLSPLSCLAPAAHCDRRQNRLWSAPEDFQIWRKNRLRSILWISSYWSPGSLEAAHIQLPDNNNSSAKMRLKMLKNKALPKEQQSQGIEYFDSFNTFSSKQKLQKAWFYLAKGKEYI